MAGADVAYSRRTHRVYAAVVVVALPSLETVETVGVARPATFPYIPGLLSFREVPPLLDAFERLAQAPDVVVFDGQGLAHPRRFGLACHAGLLLDVPSIGCAKTRLVGEHDAVPDRRGASALLRVEGETVGAVVRTRPGVNPVFVSPGHRADIAVGRRPRAGPRGALTGFRNRSAEPTRPPWPCTPGTAGRSAPPVSGPIRDFVPKRPR